MRYLGEALRWSTCARSARGAGRLSGGYHYRRPSPGTRRTGEVGWAVESESSAATGAGGLLKCPAPWLVRELDPAARDAPAAGPRPVRLTRFGVDFFGEPRGRARALRNTSTAAPVDVRDGHHSTGWRARCAARAPAPRRPLLRLGRRLHRRTRLLLFFRRRTASGAQSTHWLIRLPNTGVRDFPASSSPRKVAPAGGKPVQTENGFRPPTSHLQG